MMSEADIRAFFLQRLDAAELNRRWTPAAEPPPPAVSRGSGAFAAPSPRTSQATPLPGEFTLRAAHLAALVDAALQGALAVGVLEAIAAALDVSDSFDWDGDTREGERISRGLLLLTTPETNYPLTPIVLRKLRRYLLTGEDTFTRLDLRRRSGGRRRVSGGRRGPA